MDAQMMELQGLSVFGTLSIAFALRSIGSILLIWLALRIANNIRNSEEDNMVAKVLGTGFGILVVAGAYYWQAAYFGLRANTANNFKQLSENGMELSAGVQQFVANFASVDPVTAPGPGLILFDLIILAMIWLPSGCLKNSNCQHCMIWGSRFVPQIFYVKSSATVSRICRKLSKSAGRDARAIWRKARYPTLRHIPFLDIAIPTTAQRLTFFFFVKRAIQIDAFAF